MRVCICCLFYYRLKKFMPNICFHPRLVHTNENVTSFVDIFRNAILVMVIALAFDSQKLRSQRCSVRIQIVSESLKMNLNQTQSNSESDFLVFELGTKLMKKLFRSSLSCYIVVNFTRISRILLMSAALSCWFHEMFTHRTCWKSLESTLPLM
jgi:uncharacterized protein YpiB (UPF0302 family)